MTIFETPKSLEIDKGAFAGHETFPLRYTWLYKAVREVDEDGQVFSREDALVQFGVGKNMVRAIRHWALVTGMIEEDAAVPNNRGRTLKVTDLGRKIFGQPGWDPYLEDPATVWLIQWQLATNPAMATTWFWAFSLMPQAEFTRDKLQGWLESLAEQRGWSRVAGESLKRDVDCFVRTYVPARPSRATPVEDSLDSPLTDLGLIRELGTRGSYLLTKDDHASLPDEVFAYALLDFLRRRGTQTKTIPIETLAFTPGSPGRVFCLTEAAVLARLERIGKLTRDAVTYDETAGLRQLMIAKDIPEPMQQLTRHYGGQGSRDRRAA